MYRSCCIFIYRNCYKLKILYLYLQWRSHRWEEKLYLLPTSAVFYIKILTVCMEIKLHEIILTPKAQRDIINTHQVTIFIPFLNNLTIQLYSTFVKMLVKLCHLKDFQLILFGNNMSTNLFKKWYLFMRYKKGFWIRINLYLNNQSYSYYGKSNKN